MKLFEMASPNNLSYFGFNLSQPEEREDDNIKIWHKVTLPNGKVEVLDHSPYEVLDADTFRRYISFFKDHKRFPTREDIQSKGPLSASDLVKLTR